MKAFVMREYHVLLRKDAEDTEAPDGGIVLVPDRFSWAALFFGPFWFLWHGAWPLALATGVAWGLIGILPPAQGGIAGLLFSILTGLEGNAWRQWYMRWRGYEDIGLVLAHDADEALALALSHVNGRT